MAVFRATDGYRAWDKKVNFITRPLVNDRTIYGQGGARDLLTGEEQPFDFKRSYGCGQIASSKHLLLFRSATLGYKDLSRNAGTENFGGIRPGCWINALPAGGLVFLPGRAEIVEAKSGGPKEPLAPSDLILEVDREVVPAVVERPEICLLPLLLEAQRHEMAFDQAQLILPIDRIEVAVYLGVGAGGT